MFVVEVGTISVHDVAVGAVALGAVAVRSAAVFCCRVHRQNAVASDAAACFKGVAVSAVAAG